MSVILRSWFQSERLFLQIGIRADCYFLQIGIRADDEHDGTNVATTIDEDELRELEHPNESFPGSQDKWEVVKEGFEELKDTTGYTAAQTRR